MVREKHEGVSGVSWATKLEPAHCLELEIGHAVLGESFVQARESFTTPTGRLFDPNVRPIMDA